MSKELVRVIDGLDRRMVRVASETARIWKIHHAGFGFSRKVQVAKGSILQAFVLSFPVVFLEYSENPISDGLAGSWKANTKRENTWLLPRDCDNNELHEWLYLGNWILYACATAANRNDVQVARQSQVVFLERLLEQHLVQGAILAYHDNDPWWVALSL